MKKALKESMGSGESETTFSLLLAQLSDSQTSVGAGSDSFEDSPYRSGEAEALRDRVLGGANRRCDNSVR